ncbi:MAG: YjbQ family protein [Synechococcus sp. SB0662_bin_45]|uniref:YjbQ family protein n=1 Tax=Synechococcus sp. SB0676_bin_10 TaxID=2604869 RepID=A0A6B1FD89_9SYNE|nr:secondary thiamine-phosphate synthase enzyme YjbQ [Cyanobacteria bacterium MAG IRC3_bin_20]MCY3654650.1 secondary thiamine-phosphate synthase enzyme YjbQ [Cyanobacteria bacterium MAG IRC1_bin_28]MDE0647042.1 secondary thiamine-phosphate synthase enzyme YjbQ [Cyanobacteria bacterium MAG IRC4_bin_6]MXW11923.1 YjbQ family protein [Synechococcus sp. SB0668_bin_13]MXX09120.1 YjbQ family protein [Synechococcus sp. SB0667_bin_8]MXY19401.1 YjbQ family protein [Synechococcus sp. SB0664_bin_36]MYE20
MAQHVQRLSISTSGQGFINITGNVAAVLEDSGLRQGLICLSCLHTSASLCINENADPHVLADLLAHLTALAPTEGVRSLSGRGAVRAYRHSNEGPDDMPAHIRTMLTNTHLSLSFTKGRLLLGQWQGVYLMEHRAKPQTRVVNVHCLGD